MIEKALKTVTRPARYLGNEINVVKKDTDGKTRFLLCFPDVYEVGMSHLGLQILYYFMNRRDDTYCERAFAPWQDMEGFMRENGLKLFSLETHDDINKFDFVGFTLQYEMSYTNIVNMLDLGGIPIWAKDRGENHPLIIAGGPCAYNPEPLADMIDFFYLGCGEALLDEILDLYDEYKRENKGKDAFLEAILKFDGIYVPKFYDVAYEGKHIVSFAPNHPDAKSTIKKVFVKGLEETFYPEKMLVPLIETVHERSMVEVFRGCKRGCRFCAAGYAYRPVRERTPQTLTNQAQCLLSSSGYEELSLVSLSTGDYSGFKELTELLLERFEKDRINLSLPSLRIDAFNLSLMQRVQKVRKSSLTFAPEAGTERMRAVINKNLTREEILEGVGLAFKGGWERLKLYFMLGLPTEEKEDILGIADISGEIVECFYRETEGKRPLSVVLSASCFVPKPFTPFQWEEQNSLTEFDAKQQLLKQSIAKKQIKYNYHDSKMSVMEGVISRGDRRLAQVIVTAWQMGARFDGWSEFFNFETWENALAEHGLCVNNYTRKRELTEILPWDHISVGVTKTFLLKERERAMKGLTTPDCGEKCAGCGVTDCDFVKKAKNEAQDVEAKRFNLTFSKQGRARFIGHLDLLRLLQRCIKLSKLPIAYSEGFNPHQLIFIALPLPLGVASVCENVEMRFECPMYASEVIERLNAVMPEGIVFTEIKPIVENEKKFASQIKACEYKITCKNGFNEDFINAALSVLDSSAILIEKKTKSKRGLANIRSGILGIKCDSNLLTLTLASDANGEVISVKPSQVLDEISKRCGQVCDDFHITRTKIILN